MLSAGIGVGPVGIRRPGNEALLTAWVSGRHALPEWTGVLNMQPEGGHSLLFRLGEFLRRQPHDA
eukprot:6885931-Alexandrium_andersonii.AAC.1